ncbi:MAG: sulfotransferase family 2 domain-containing protein [Cyanobacteria bacterium J06597_16]
MHLSNPLVSTYTTMQHSSPEQPLVIFLHLPKTAGTTLKHITRRQYSPSETFEFYSVTRQPAKGINGFISLPEKRKENMKFVTGHIGFGLHQFIDKPSTYITVLRDPIKRVISFYHYLQRTNPNHQSLEGIDSLERFVQSADLVRNDMTKYLSNVKMKTQLAYKGGDAPEDRITCTPEDLEQAKENLRTHFSVVGLTEEFDKTMVLIRRKLGWQVFPYLNANVAKKKTSSRAVSEEAMALLKEYNSYDVELYQYAQSLFQAQISAQGDDFAVEYKTFEKELSEHTVGLKFKLNSFYNRASHKLYEVLN